MKLFPDSDDKMFDLCDGIRPGHTINLSEGTLVYDGGDMASDSFIDAKTRSHAHSIIGRYSLVVIVFAVIIVIIVNVVINFFSPDNPYADSDMTFPLIITAAFIILLIYLIYISIRGVINCILVLKVLPYASKHIYRFKVRNKTIRSGSKTSNSHYIHFGGIRVNINVWEYKDISIGDYVDCAIISYNGRTFFSYLGKQQGEFC